MFSKFLIAGLMVAVANASSCLENGKPDDDCCALPGTMSCSGGNRLKPSTNVCWTGTYQGKKYTAYNYACYPTTAPAGHNPAMCLEDGKKDDDCCAVKGHESCASGYKVQVSTNACFANAQIQAYSYFCTAPKGSQNDAACKPAKCTSPGPDGKKDCWAGNGEAFTCADNYNAKMTGKSTAYQGKTWHEYTCCPGVVSACTTDKCNSPGPNGGTDCWAGNGEAFTCTGGFTPKMTGQTTSYQGKTWRQYTCCPAPSTCSASKCTSPNGNGGHDCWAGNGEPFTCAGGYTSKLTGNTAPNQGKTYREYTCCQVSGSSTDNQKCVASACREYNKNHFDNDCCGVVGQTFCADGFTQSVQDNGCRKRNGPTHRGTCCTKNGQHHTTAKAHSHADASKCLSNNCCAMAGTEKCKDGFKVTTTKHICFKYQNLQAHTYTCTPPTSMNPNPAEPKACRENGRLDNDCCALKGTNSCAAGYDMEQTSKVCFKSSQFTAYAYSCHKTDIAVVHG